MTGFTFYAGDRPHRQGYPGEADIAMGDPARARTLHAIHTQDRRRHLVAAP